MSDTEHKAMTYREIHDYTLAENWNMDHPARQAALKAGYLPGDPASMPWAVERWLTHEVLPTIRKTGRYACRKTSTRFARTPTR